MLNWFQALMLAGAITWNILTWVLGIRWSTRLRLPVSTSYAISGAKNVAWALLG
jgi:hypothetical protein